MVTTTAHGCPLELISHLLLTLCEEISKLWKAVFCTALQSPTASKKKHSTPENFCWWCGLDPCV